MNESPILIEILIVVLLILINSVLAMAEMAVISARKTRLQAKAEDGDKGAVAALKLAENPSRFLSTVQVGITLIGILSGAFSGATIAEEIAAAVQKTPVLAPYGEVVGVGTVVLVITFLSLVVGELVPKRLALNNAEKTAAALSPLMQMLAKIAAPVVAVLSASTNATLRLLGARKSAEPEVTEEDLKSMLDQGTEEGVFEESEQDMVERIFRLSDQNVSALITPRTEMITLDFGATQDEIHTKITSHPFSRFPVIHDNPDHVLGIVQARDLLLQRVEGGPYDLQKALQQPLFIPESTAALDVLTRFKTTGAEMAVIIDEYGGVMGLVSMNDLLEAIVGDVLAADGTQESEAIQREDGSWLFDGMILVGELKEHLDLDELPDEEDGAYETLSGLVMAQLGRIPTSGDAFEWDGLRFEVVDMDNRRVDKVLVTAIPTAGADVSR
jgi:putative hemolysin